MALIALHDDLLRWQAEDFDRIAKRAIIEHPDAEQLILAVMADALHAANRRLSRTCYGMYSIGYSNSIEDAQLG